jgi:hypothetical protein
MEGPFLSIFNRDAVLDIAKLQPGRQLAVVILIRYTNEGEEESVRQKWTSLLKEVGYQRIVFLRGHNGMQVNGLAVLASRG